MSFIKTLTNTLFIGGAIAVTAVAASSDTAKKLAKEAKEGFMEGYREGYAEAVQKRALKKAQAQEELEKKIDEKIAAMHEQAIGYYSKTAIVDGFLYTGMHKGILFNFFSEKNITDINEVFKIVEDDIYVWEDKAI